MTTTDDSTAPAFEVFAPMERVNAPQTFWRGFPRAVREIWRYRELLVNLVRKDLKVKYKASSLGFFWSLLRPMLLLAIYYVAIGKFLGNRLPDFIVFLFSGLAMWFFISEVVQRSVVSITGNRGLIKKVYFPREILPLAAIGVAFVQFLIMLAVLFTVTFAVRGVPDLQDLAVLPLAIAVLLLFVTAVALLVSAMNVFLRDTQHLIEVGLLALFYMSPILYAVETVRDTLSAGGAWVEALYLCNPVAILAIGFQDAIYQQGVDDQGNQILYSGHVAGRLLVLGAVCCVLVFLAQRVFARAQGNFAQSL